MTDAKADAAPSDTDKAAEEMTEEQIWQEMSDGEAGEVGQPPEDPDDKDGKTPPDDDATSDVTAGTDGDGEPSPETEQGDKDDDSDLWAGATEAQRKELEKLQTERDTLAQTNKRLKGTVSAKDRNFTKLQERLKALQEQVSGDEDEELKRVKEDYPEVAAPLLKQTERSAKVIEAITDWSSEGAQREADEQASHVQEQASIMKERHPDWGDVIKSDPEAFRSWVDDQPKATRDAVSNNFDLLTDADALSDVITQYKAHQSGTGGNPKPSSRRESQMRGAKTFSGGGAKATAADPLDSLEDEEAIWREMARRDEGRT